MLLLINCVLKIITKKFLYYIMFLNYVGMPDLLFTFPLRVHTDLNADADLKCLLCFM